MKPEHCFSLCFMIILILIKACSFLINDFSPSRAGYSKLASVPAGGAVAVAASGAPAAGGAAAPAG